MKWEWWNWLKLKSSNVNTLTKFFTLHSDASNIYKGVTILTFWEAEIDHLYENCLKVLAVSSYWKETDSLQFLMTFKLKSHWFLNVFSHISYWIEVLLFKHKYTQKYVAILTHKLTLCKVVGVKLNLNFLLNSCLHIMSHFLVLENFELIRNQHVFELIFKSMDEFQNHFLSGLLQFT